MRQTYSQLADYAVLLLVTCAAPCVAQSPDEAAPTFLERCAPCHTIGGGELTGPDLVSAATMDAETRRSEIERMQDYAGPLTEGEIDRLAELLGDPDAATRVQEAERAAAADEAAAAELAEASPERGAALFSGAQELANGGLACAACHRATGSARGWTGSGGTLAADLAGAAERLGTAGLLSASEKTPFPVMRSAYRDRPVTHEEALDLTAFLLSAEPAPDAGRAGLPLVPWGVGGALLGFALVALLYRGRNQRHGGVRARLIREATAGRGR